MKIWQQYPFIRMMLPFAAGIVIAINSGHRNDYPLFAAIIVLFALHFWLTFLFIKKITFRNLWLTGLPANLLLFLFGYQITLLNTGSLSYDNIFRFSGEDCEMIIIVSEPPVEKTSSFKVIGCPEYIRDSAGWKNVSGTILLYFEKDTLVSDIEYGDEITLVAALNPVSPPQNPAEFDYRRYLSNRGIYNQAYVKSGNWIITRHDKGWPVISAAIDLRNHFLNILESNGITGDEFAVV
ncbi:MAG: DUF4131 domain-containing protein, partial [Bacteroidetes bacterium]|nr:DUF4131 domain-containing protein [Bacteroidota bacterium]